jgi:hypothetical protein
MSFERLAETRIKDAMEAGAFENLAGTGRPLPALDQDGLAGNNWMAFRVLRNGGLLPSWLDLAKEIERDLERLAAIDRRHELLSEAVSNRGWNPPLRSAVRVVRDEYEKLARQIRRKQDQFNIDAPALATERPGIWVERHLERLDARLPGDS